MSSALARDILDLTLEHLFLVSVAMGIAAALAIPAGILLTRRTFLQRWVLGFANVMQTVPSLALFGFLIPLPFLGGIGKHTAIVALVLYALLPILRNTLTGILSVDPAVRESAHRHGHDGTAAALGGRTPAGDQDDSGRPADRDRDDDRDGDNCRGHWRRWARCVYFSRPGIRRYDAAAGRCGSGCLDRSGGRSRTRMGRTQIVACVIVGLWAAGLVGCTREHPITVGSKNFTEQVVLGEIIAQHLEYRLGHSR